MEHRWNINGTETKPNLRIPWNMATRGYQISSLPPKKRAILLKKQAILLIIGCPIKSHSICCLRANRIFELDYGAPVLRAFGGNLVPQTTDTTVDRRLNIDGI